jgi:DNA replication protein
MTTPHPTTEQVLPFEGFRTGAQAVTLPAELFSALLPLIEDEAELRVTLYSLYAIGRRRGQLRAVRGSELASETALLRSLEGCGGIEVIGPSLVAAVARGALVECALDDGDTLYFVNNEGGRRQRERVQSGALPLSDGRRAAPVIVSEQTKPALVYEQEIGTLTPAVASALSEAEASYPEAWVVDALRLAATNNARSWRYAEAILRRWEAEGREDEATRGDARTADPYGHVYRRE